MRVVVALGGNALLRRGQALSAENQRENARAACKALAPVALEHELVISHGNGPQVGLLALQGSAYTAVDTYPLDVLGAQTEGMIGYMLEQELGNELPFERHLATLLTMIEVDPDDPAFERPTKPIGPLYDAAEAARLEREKGWAFMADGDSMRRAVPSPAPKRIFGIHVIRTLLDQGVIVICAGGGGIPTAYADEPAPPGRRLRGVEAVIDKDLASALLAIEIGADALAIVTDVDAVYADWGTPDQRRSGTRRPSELAASEFAAGSMGPRSAPPAGSPSAPAASPRSDRSTTRRRCSAARPARGRARRRRPCGLIEETEMATTDSAPTDRRPTAPSGTCSPRGRGARAARRAGARPDERRGRRAPRALRAEPVRRGEGGVALARVPAPVPGPDADRPAGRRRDLDLPGQAAGHGHRDPAAHAAQRGARPQPGGQGRGGGGGAREDDDRQGARAPRRRARAAAGRAARARRRRRDRGRRRGPGRRARAGRGDAGGRRGGADRREPAGRQGRRAGRGGRRAARRPHRHGLHEHQRHPRDRRVRRHRDRDGDRGRPHLRDAADARTSPSRR